MAFGDLKTGICQQIIARSKNIYGPYEPSPHNPVILETSPNSKLTNTEHAMFIKIPNGEW